MEAVITVVFKTLVSGETFKSYASPRNHCKHRISVWLKIQALLGIYNDVVQHNFEMLKIF
jgi:hypothetical protein